MSRDGHGAYNGWIDCSSGSVPHYSLKVLVRGYDQENAPYVNIVLRTKIGLGFKNPKQSKKLMYLLYNKCIYVY